MNHEKLQKKVAKYHATFEPDFRRICARAGVADTPGVCWASIVCPHGSILVAATILWDGKPPPDRTPAELLSSSSPDHIVARPEIVAELAARRVIAVNHGS